MTLLTGLFSSWRTFRDEAMWRVMPSVALITTLIVAWLATTAYGAGPDDLAGKIRSGYSLVDRFYQCLASDKRAQHCADLFSPIPGKDTALLWKYLDSNKALFYREASAFGDKQYFQNRKKIVSFLNPQGMDITRGHMYITVFHNLPDQFYSGIFKEIAFPIVEGAKEGDYQIEFYNIRINGVLLDIDDDFKRDFDLFKELGFKNSHK